MDQQAAVELALTATACLIEGPPGTGKTQVITAMCEDAGRRGLRVLVTSTERSALDVLRRRSTSLDHVTIASIEAIAADAPTTIGCADYDILVIDEASRLSLATAATLLCRARSIVIIGDDRQLRPDAGDKTILDKARELGLPTQTLRFHYRSKERTLISPSNIMSYGSMLKTVPTLELLPNNGLKLAYVDGRCTSGPDGIENHGEADAIIAELKVRARDPGSRSIAVTTANAAQERLIIRRVKNELTDEERSRFNEVTAERLLIRQASDIQGEERDIVLVSMVYDHTTEKFGRFDGESGRNLANVMLSRSRHEMIVYFSYEPTKENVKLTYSRGKLLFHFLYSCIDTMSTTETRQLPPTPYIALADRLGMEVDHLGIVLGIRKKEASEYCLGLIPLSSEREMHDWEAIERQLKSVGWLTLKATEEDCRLRTPQLLSEIRRKLQTGPLQIKAT